MNIKEPRIDVIPEEGKPMNDYFVIILHFAVLIGLASAIPITTEYVQKVILGAFILLLVKTVKEWSRRF